MLIVENSMDLMLKTGQNEQNYYFAGLNRNSNDVFNDKKSIFFRRQGMKYSLKRSMN